MNLAYQLTVAPTAEPVSVDVAKRALRIVSTDEDAKIERDIKACRMQIERYLGRGLVTQTWKYAQDAFTDTIRLPMAGPLASVTSVKYYNTSGTLTTLSTSVYEVDTLSEPGCVRLAPDQVWPQLQVGKALAVEVTYVVGVAAASVNPDIVDALLLMVGDRWEHRENTVVGVGIAAIEIPSNSISILASQRMSWWPVR